MRRLYKQVYLAVIASLVMGVVFGGMLWQFAPQHRPSDEALEVAGELVATLLPPATESTAVQQQAIDKLYARLKIDLALFDQNRELLAAAGGYLPRPRGETGGWVYGKGGPAWAIRLPDDRWIVARMARRRGPPVLGILAFLGAVALAVAVCAYPLVRRLTRRLERLQTGVEQLAAGDLRARVKVEGRDEIAALAESFNRAAMRIEELVGSHKLLLAHASHELRTPLSRIRMGVELLKENADPKRKRELERDIGELDALIDEILLSSRLDATKQLDRGEEVDLLALAAEEGARFEGCAVSGQPVTVTGDRSLLRRMTRNLIENAERHGAPPIEIEVRREGAMAALTVSDGGDGVAEADRERVFTPFFRGAGKSGTSGTGLGLTLVRQIARQHGGDAVWAATPERPSRIRVLLPTAHAGVRAAERRLEL